MLKSIRRWMPVAARDSDTDKGARSLRSERVDMRGAVDPTNSSSSDDRYTNNPCSA
jgi:hypothetical protein